MALRSEIRVNDPSADSSRSGTMEERLRKRERLSVGRVIGFADDSDSVAEADADALFSPDESWRGNGT